MARFAIDWRYNCHTNEHFLHEVIDLFDKNDGMFNGHDAGVRGIRYRGEIGDYYITFFGVNEKELDAIIALCNYGAYEIDTFNLRKTIHLAPWPKN